MLTSKLVQKSTVIGLLALGLAACSENPMSPVGLSPDGAAPLLSEGTSGRGQVAGSRQFTIWPGQPVNEKFGDHVLNMPANVVCDPATSGYGASLWDLPCVPASQPIVVTATWSTYNDRPAISFSPDLRFVPSSDESRWVNLWLKDSKGIDPDLYYAILWYDKAAGQWVDESKADASLRARTYQSGNLVARRLKHFSDYELWSGLGSYNVTSGLGGEIYGLGGW
jgi:hypothetical protein